MRLNVSKSGMRAELATCVEGMRRLRKTVLTDGRIDEERREEYREHVTLAASYVEALEDRKKTDPLKRSIADNCNADSALLKYDPIQNGWWAECEQGSEFLRTLQVLSAYYLRGGLCDIEDTFHIFQIAKYFLETDREQRKRPDFVLPVYGGLPLPREHLAALLGSMTGIPHLVPEGESPGPTLSLDWYPDSDARGCEEVGKVIDASRKLGYSNVEFSLADGYGYEELYLRYPSLSAELDGKRRWRATLSSPAAAREMSRIGKLFRATEIEGKTLVTGVFENQPIEYLKLPLGDFNIHMTSNPVLIFGGNGLLCMSHCDSLGFATRFRFTVEKRENQSTDKDTPVFSLNGGIYTFRKETNRIDDPGELCTLAWMISVCFYVYLGSTKKKEQQTGSELFDQQSVAKVFKEVLMNFIKKDDYGYMVEKNKECESDFESMGAGSR